MPDTKAGVQIHYIQLFNSFSYETQPKIMMVLMGAISNAPKITIIIIINTIIIIITISTAKQNTFFKT